MTSRANLWIVVGLGLVLGGASTHADEAGRANVDPRPEIMLPFHDLAFDATVRIEEGPRMLGDEFPYLAAASREDSNARAVEIVPVTLPSLLKAAPQEGGHAPARIRTGQAAIEAVRLFLAGPIVADAATAEALIETGRGLAPGLEHLVVEVTAHRPDTWEPRAEALPQDRSRHPTETWAVSLVAFELDRMLRLVHVEAKVTAEGVVTLERRPIVNGPMTSWQTVAMGEDAEEEENREKAMRAEAGTARRAYARALRPARRLDTFWAAGRVLHDMEDVRALFGAPDRDVGSGIHIWTYDLADDTSIVFGGSADRVVYVHHVRGARGPMAAFETLGTIYAGPAR